MKELNDIIQAYDKAVLQNKQTALATVVKVEGSSYRRPGARMLVTEDGAITGAISGGCLEGDALRKAQFAMFEQKNKLEIYDTTDEEDHKLGVQLGCNGIVYILFEPIKKEDDHNPVMLLKKIAQQRKDAVLVTVFNESKAAAQKGTCCCINDTESFFPDAELAPLQKECRTVLSEKSSVVKTHNKQSVLYQFIPPALQLILVGAGNDVQPLVDMAFLLGWNITVADGRPAYATQQRFPKADKISVAKPADVLSVAAIDEQTAVILMTHNYNYDLAAFEQLINTGCKYIGVLGPKKKIFKMMDELNNKGIVIGNENLQNIYSPVGLDIGAETSEEIALSIIAEIKAVFSKRHGSSLKERTTAIHERPLISSNE
ncbi:MAG TPA: XdhC/CoxI family protein [Parafilimonas sp.]|nr:XdhC/CoxI family protein [Parafilimonas sp.]